MRKYAIISAAFVLVLLLCACSGIFSTGNVRPEITSSPEEPAETEQVEQVFASSEIVLANLNIKHGAEGLDNVASAIREVSPDIIGLEEVDVGCERSGYVDEPAELARLAGYDYFAFSKAISLGGGEYGTAILSRYPIENFEVIALDRGNGEGRSVGHAVINFNGLKLDVLVTHLSYEDSSARYNQMTAIGAMLEGYGRYALLGDLNCFNLEEISNLNGAYYVNRPDRRYETFRPFPGFCPDNIVVSDGFTELSSGISEAECSDHKLLFATFMLSGE